MTRRAKVMFSMIRFKMKIGYILYTYRERNRIKMVNEIMIKL